MNLKDIKIEKKSELGREVTITVPAKEAEAIINQTTKKYVKNVKIDGFRPGKAPVSVIKSKYKKQIESEAVREIVSSSLAKVIADEKLELATQPQVNDVPLEEGKDYTFTSTFDLMPEIDPKGFEKVKLTKHVAKPSEKLTNELLDKFLSSQTEYKSKKANSKAKEGDQVKMNAIGYKDDVAFEGGKLDNYPLVLGSKAFIPGFEDGLIGTAKGDKVSLDLKFPEEYHAKELAGADVRFDVEVLDVLSPEAAELTDDLAKKFGYESADKLKEIASDRIKEDLEHASEQKLRRELFDILDKKNKFELPESMVEAEFRSIWQALMMDLAKSGKSIKDMDKSEEELKTEHRSLAQRRVRLGLVLSKIGQNNKIEVKEEQINSEIDKIINMYPQQVEQIREYYNSQRGRNELVGPLYEKAVCDFIYSQADIKEKEVEAEELIKEIQ